MPKNILLALLLPLSGCQHTKSQPATEPVEATGDNERVINPWSSSSHPNSAYHSLGQNSNVINPWEKSLFQAQAPRSAANSLLPTPDSPVLAQTASGSVTTPSGQSQQNANLVPTTAVAP